MTCIHGQDPAAAPTPLESDEALMEFLGIPDTPANREKVSGFTKEQLDEWASLRAVCRELEAGRIPRGVIACNRVGRTVR